MNAETAPSIPRQPTLPMHPDYATYEARSLTFATNCSDGDLSDDIRQLAEYGFFQTGCEDVVCCFHCGIRMLRRPGDDALLEHIKASSSCQHLEDTVEPLKLNMAKAQLETVPENSDNCACCNIGATSSDDSTYEGRLRSFSTWPSNIVIQTPEQLAEAGFVYNGYLDITRCFSCNGVLRNWQQTDIPWVEHARWFPDCLYVRRIKGDDYVEYIRQMFLQPTDKKLPRRNIPRDPPETVTQVNAQSIDLPCPDLPELEHVTALWQVMGVIRPWHKELDHPVYSLAASSLCRRYGFSRTAVRMVLDEMKEAGLTMSWEAIKNLLLDRVERGEVLPTDPPINKPFSLADLEGVSLDDVRLENQLILRLLYCKVCEDGYANIMFLPCGHLVTCAECATDVAICPVCNKTIKTKVRVFRA